MSSEGSASTTQKRQQRRFGAMSVAGAALVLTMLLACVCSLPYTLARVPAQAHVDSQDAQAGSSTPLQPRRYEATDARRAMLPPFWARHSLEERARAAEYSKSASSGWRSILGTDRLGRSLLIRCLAGGSISLGIGLAAAMLSVLIGTIYGTIAGFRGGRTDALMMRIVDVTYGLPYILLVVLLVVAVNGMIERADARAFEQHQQATGWFAALYTNKALLNVVTLLVAIGGVSWLTMARVIRGQVLSLKQQPFMEACRAIGVPLRRQFFVHLLPNLLGPIIVYATLTVPAAILSESFLSFLGIGVQEPLPSWGNLAAAGLSELNTVRARWWMLLWPCLFIGITLLALNFMGEGLRERFDPKRASVR